MSRDYRDRLSFSRCRPGFDGERWMSLSIFPDYLYLDLPGDHDQFCDAERPSRYWAVEAIRTRVTSAGLCRPWKEVPVD